jgi:hypothetical protein
MRRFFTVHFISDILLQSQWGATWGRSDQIWWSGWWLTIWWVWRNRSGGIHGGRLIGEYYTDLVEYVVMKIWWSSWWQTIWWVLYRSGGVCRYEDLVELMVADYLVSIIQIWWVCSYEDLVELMVADYLVSIIQIWWSMWLWRSGGAHGAKLSGEYEAIQAWWSGWWQSIWWVWSYTDMMNEL